MPAPPIEWLLPGNEPLPFKATGTVSYTHDIPPKCQVTNTPTNGTFALALEATYEPEAIGTDSISFRSTIIPEMASTPFVARCPRGQDEWEDVLLDSIATPLDSFKFQDAIDAIDGFSRTSSLYSLKLDLACPLHTSDSGDFVPPVTVSPPDNQQWPLTLDHSKTPAEIAALKTTPRGLNAGLTLFRPNSIHVNINWTGAPAKFGTGACFWIPDMSIAFGPIEMYIAINYAEGSCEYIATHDHEDKHYKAYTDIMRTYSEYLRERISRFRLPTEKKPGFSATLDSGVARVEEVVKRMVRDTISTMEDQMRQETTLLEQETATVLAKCNNW